MNGINGISLDSFLEKISNGIIVFLACFNCVYFINKQLHLSFNELAHITRLLIMLLAGSILWKKSEMFPLGVRTEVLRSLRLLTKTDFYLIGCMMGAGIITQSLNSPEEDDSFYAAPVVFSRT
jgi:hypothetical protein